MHEKVQILYLTLQTYIHRKNNQAGKSIQKNINSQTGGHHQERLHQEVRQE